MDEIKIKQLIKLCNGNNGYIDHQNICQHLTDLWKWENYIKYTKSCLEIHTGGWSEHEYIIAKMQNTMFWIRYWWRSDRGGHFYFKFN